MAKSCRIFGNRMQAMLVKDGARSEMFMCEAMGGVDGSAVEVTGSKSRSVEVTGSKSRSGFGLLSPIP